MKKTKSLQEKILEMINSKHFQELENAVNTLSMFTVMGSAYTERWHSSFISWLLNPKSDHGIGKEPLKKMLHLLNIKKEKLKNTDSQAYYKWTIPSYEVILTSKFRNIDVLPNTSSIIDNQEKTVNFNNKKLSFDVALTANIDNHGEGIKSKKILLIIENKIRSKENKEQTKMYSEWAYGKNVNFPISSNNKNSNFSYRTLIFLTPNGTAPKDPRFIPISYQEFMDFVLVPSYHHPDNSKRGKFLISEYIEALSDIEYCTRLRDYKNVKNMMKDFEKTFYDMIHAVSPSTPMNISLKNLINTGLLDKDAILTIKNVNYLEIRLKEVDFDYLYQIGESTYSDFDEIKNSFNIKKLGMSNLHTLIAGKDISLNKLKKEYIKQKSKEKSKAFSDEECFFADLIMNSKLEIFQLIERLLIKYQNIDSLLPIKFTKSTKVNIDYSILFKYIANESGCIDVYFKNNKECVAEILKAGNLCKIKYNGTVDTPLEQTKKAAKDTMQSNQSGSYQWSQYWYIKNGKSCDKKIIEVYNDIMDRKIMQ